MISIVVMISALGAMNGLIFTGSRVYLSLGKEHRVFSLLGHWNATLKSPIWALLAQACVGYPDDARGRHRHGSRCNR